MKNGPLYQVLACSSALYLCHRFPWCPFSMVILCACFHRMESPFIPKHRNYERSLQQISPLSSWVCVWVAELNWLWKTNRQQAHCYPSALVGGTCCGEAGNRALSQVCIRLLFLSSFGKVTDFISVRSTCGYHLLLFSLPWEMCIIHLPWVYFVIADFNQGTCTWMWQC